MGKGYCLESDCTQETLRLCEPSFTRASVREMCALPVISEDSVSLNSEWNSVVFPTPFGPGCRQEKEKKEKKKRDKKSKHNLFKFKGKRERQYHKSSC